MTKNTSDLLDQILTHGPSQGTLFLVLNSLKEQGHTHKIIQGCLKGLEIYPDDIRIRMLLAESYLDAGFIGQAESELDRVTRELELLNSAYKLQAIIYARQHRAEEAFKSLKRYLSLNPDDPEGLRLLEEFKPGEPAVEPEEQLPKERLEPDQKIEPADQMYATEPEIKAAKETVGPETVAEPFDKAPAIEVTESAPLSEALAPTGEALRPEAAEEQPEETVVDLSTPTLAELYFSQGQIHEAINTYEKILSNHPDDMASAQRLNELKASIAEEMEPLPSEGDLVRAKTEKTIKLLEQWRTRIRTLRQGRISSSH